LTVGVADNKTEIPIEVNINQGKTDYVFPYFSNEFTYDPSLSLLFSGGKTDSLSCEKLYDVYFYLTIGFMAASLLISIVIMFIFRETRISKTEAKIERRSLQGNRETEILA